MCMQPDKQTHACMHVQCYAEYWHSISCRVLLHAYHGWSCILYMYIHEVYNSIYMYYYDMHGLYIYVQIIHIPVDIPMMYCNTLVGGDIWSIVCQATEYDAYHWYHVATSPGWHCTIQLHVCMVHGNICMDIGHIHISSLTLPPCLSQAHAGVVTESALHHQYMHTTNSTCLFLCMYAYAGS